MFATLLTSPPDEQDVVTRFLLQPSEESFHKLFREFAPRIVGYFRVRGCAAEQAEDLTQEVMLQVYRQAHCLRDGELFRPWLYRIARNVLLRLFRDRSRRITTVDFGAASEELGESNPDLLLHSQFAEWMEYLSSEERQIMMLRYVDDLQHHEIADVLGMPLGTVQWKIFHCKRKLAARFGGKAT